MGFISKDEGIAASIFLALYVIYSAFAIYIVFQKGLKSVYTSLLFFGVIRVGAQLSGVAFSSLGLDHWQWLVAYLVLGAEGYFALIISVFYLYSHCLRNAFGYSFIEYKIKGRFFKQPIKAGFHWILVVANALIIAGGSMLTSVNIEDYDTAKLKMNASKIMRCTGQSIFLLLTVSLIYCMLHTIFVRKLRKYDIFLLLSTSPFLLVRGIYGLLASVVDKMNYYKISNYDRNGLSVYFIATEYCLATSMEFIAASILLVLYFMERRRNVAVELESLSDSKESIKN